MTTLLLKLGLEIRVKNRKLAGRKSQGDWQNPIFKKLKKIYQRRVCNRKFGVGADSLIAVGKPVNPGSVGTMRMFNYDGSESEMCGNGIRCAAKLLFDRKLNSSQSQFFIDTISGTKSVEITETGKELFSEWLEDSFWIQIKMTEVKLLESKWTWDSQC